MRTINTFFTALVALSVTLLVGCGEGETIRTNAAQVSPYTLTFEADGSEVQTVTLSTTETALQFEAQPSESWITVTAGETPDIYHVQVAEYAEGTARTGNIEFTSSKYKATVSVTQNGIEGLTDALTFGTALESFYAAEDGYFGTYFVTENQRYALTINGFTKQGQGMTQPILEDGEYTVDQAGTGAPFTLEMGVRDIVFAPYGCLLTYINLKGNAYASMVMSSGKMVVSHSENERGERVYHITCDFYGQYKSDSDPGGSYMTFKNMKIIIDGRIPFLGVEE